MPPKKNIFLEFKNKFHTLYPKKKWADPSNDESAPIPYIS